MDVKELLVFMQSVHVSDLYPQLQDYIISNCIYIIARQIDVNYGLFGVRKDLFFSGRLL